MLRIGFCRTCASSHRKCFGNTSGLAFCRTPRVEPPRLRYCQGQEPTIARTPYLMQSRSTLADTPKTVAYPTGFCRTCASSHRKCSGNTSGLAFCRTPRVEPSRLRYCQEPTTAWTPYRMQSRSTLAATPKREDYPTGDHLNERVVGNQISLFGLNQKAG